MKAISKAIYFISLISFGLVSCEDADFFPCVKPIGTKTEEFRFTHTFQNVQLSLHSNVYISKGENFSISINAAQNIIDLVDIYSNGTTLFIDNSRCLRTRANDITINITMPELSAVRLSGSGNIYVQTPFEGNKISVEVSGSGNVLFPEANYENTSLALSGSGKINLGGFSHNSVMQVTGSGKINAFDLHSTAARVRISGSGNVNLHVTDFLEGNITGSGHIYYTGNPSVSLSITGSGRLIHLNGDHLF